MSKTDLSAYDNSWYKTGASGFKQLTWYFTNHLIFNHGLFPVSIFKVLLLKIYGAKVGKGVNIKPSVNIKYPWKLTIGNDVWIGENVWIDNLAQVEIGDNVCVSQGALLLTGNHDYTKAAFDLMVKPIILQEGVWIGAKAIVGPGVTCHTHSVLSVASVAIHDLEEFSIYSGNPAKKVKKRTIG